MHMTVSAFLTHYSCVFVGLCVRWLQLLQTVNPVQSSCVSESADLNSGLAPRISTPLWYDMITL